MLSAKASKSDYAKAVGTLLLGLCILGAFMVVLGGNWFWVKYDKYRVSFASVKDLSPGRTVKYAGLDIGRVAAIDLDPANPRRIAVGLDIRRGFPLYEGTVARIAQKGLVGDYYVLLELRGEPGPRLQPGSDLPAISTMDMQELAAKAGEMLDDVRPKINEIADNIAKLFTEENTESLKRALEGTPVLVEDLRRAANDFRKNWDMLSAKGGLAADSLDKTLRRMEKAVTSLEGELTRTLENFRKQGDRIGGLVGDVRQGFGYDQEQLEDILKNLNRTSREIKELSGRLRERPWELLRPPTGK
ncbi:MAG: MlaD family protein [Solidesulfovibrio sp.]|uniref:MlaD family protein n=1 Tax=Solidesulfovibrio sp. TaxID=2910990 RepID=UPI002B1EEF31|nr:MlaD family protein [Solidesulfovibrio sp.]MEA4857479.1 MlaD family protein [Solidesulfovibrio sp.]